METKIFKDENRETLCTMINNFQKDNIVKFTQYQPVVANGMIIYTAMVFFTPEDKEV